MPINVSNGIKGFMALKFLLARTNWCELSFEGQ